MTSSRPTTPTLVLRVLLALGLAFCPLLSSATAALPSLALAVPAEEEEERSEEKRGETETELVEEWTGIGQRQDSQPSRSAGTLLPPTTTHRLAGRHLLRAAAFDPFCNGLGSPYRC